MNFYYNKVCLVHIKNQNHILKETSNSIKQKDSLSPLLLGIYYGYLPNRIIQEKKNKGIKIKKKSAKLSIKNFITKN
jgi:hypothetical protein